MGFSTNTYTYSGGDQTFPVTFTLGFISRSDVTARINEAVDGNDDPVYANFTWLSDSQIEIDDALTVGDTVEISRTISKTELAVDFGAGADITPKNLSAQQLQMLMIVHELLDNRIEGDLKGLSDLLIGSALEDIGLSQDAREGAEAAQAAAEAATIHAVDAMEAAQTFSLAEATDEEIIIGEAERFVSPAGLATANQFRTVAVSGGTLSLDLSTSLNFKTTISSNTVVENPASPFAGQSGHIVIAQSAGGYSTSWGSVWRFSGGLQPDTTGDTQYSLFRYVVLNEAEVLVTHIPNI